MALKADRNEIQTDISFFMNEVAERGGMLCHGNTAGSGAAMDQGQAVVTYAANPSGRVPVGILLNDVVNIDLTRQKLNNYKNEVQRGSKVTVLRKGYVVTNRIQGAVAGGNPVFVGHSGLMAATNVTGNTTVCGAWMGGVDQDGYAKVEINLPANTR